MRDKDYLEKIKNAVVVKPDNSTKITYLLKEKDGKLITDAILQKGRYTNIEIAVSRYINDLMGEKVIFFPLKTNEEHMRLEELMAENNGDLVFEFDVTDNEFGNEKIISRIRAQFYEPFDKSHAKRVKSFLMRYVHNKK